jgi:hypothetical protein
LIDRDDDMERLMDSEKEGDAVGRKVVQQLQHDGACFRRFRAPLVRRERFCFRKLGKHKLWVL